MANPYLNIDYKSLYDFDPEEETFSNTKDTRIKSYAMQAKTVVQSNQSAKTAKLTKVIKLWIIIKKPVYRLKQLQNY